MFVPLYTLCFFSGCFYNFDSIPGFQMWLQNDFLWFSLCLFRLVLGLFLGSVGLHFASNICILVETFSYFFLCPPTLDHLILSHKSTNAVISIRCGFVFPLLCAS